MEERDQLLNAAKQPSKTRTGNRPLNLATRKALVSLTVGVSVEAQAQTGLGLRENRKRAGGSEYRQLSKGAENGGNSLLGDAESRE